MSETIAMKIISGMHRSGTSLVARLLHEAGADLGDPASLYPGDPWNPDGYFEQPAFHAINIPLIHGPYGKLAYLWLPSPETIEARAVKMREEIRRTGKEYRGRIVKETRFCLTMGAWISQGAHIDRVSLVLRKPVEVARSLLRRNRIPLRLGYSLWHAHNERLLRAARAHNVPVHVVRYDLLLDSRRQGNEVLQAFRFMGVDIEPARARQLVAQVATESKNKSRSEGPANHYSAAVKDLWERLLERHWEQPRGSEGRADDE